MRDPTDRRRGRRSLLTRPRPGQHPASGACGSCGAEYGCGCVARWALVAEKGRVDFEHELAPRVAVAAQFQAAYAAHRRDEPRAWAAQTPFPWLRSLSSDEVDEFAQELIAYTLDAAQRRTLENLEGNLRAWRSTAEIYEQPEVLAEMMAAIDLDMSVKEPYDSNWKERVRTRIRGCDGVIALISKNTPSAAGERWEIQCAIDEGKPLLGLWIYKGDRTEPDVMKGQKIVVWTWEAIADFIDSL